MFALKKMIFIFFIINWKYFLSNINSVFEYSVVDRIRLYVKVYQSPTPHTHTHTHTPFTYITNSYHRSKNYFLFVSLFLFGGWQAWMNSRELAPGLLPINLLKLNYFLCNPRQLYEIDISHVRLHWLRSWWRKIFFNNWNLVFP